MTNNSDNIRDTLSFAISLIGFCIISLFTIIPHIVSKDLNFYTSIALRYVQLLLYSMIFFMTLYILMMGFSLSSRVNINTKKRIQHFCSYIYEASFYLIYIGVIFTILVYYSSLIAVNDKDFNIYIIIDLIIISIVRLIYVNYNHIKKRIDRLHHKQLIYILALFILSGIYGYTIITDTLNWLLVIILILSLIVLLAQEIITITNNCLRYRNGVMTFIVFLIMFLGMTSVFDNLNLSSTDIEITMNDVYNTNQKVIPVDVEIKGLNSFLAVYLYNESNLQFSQIAYMGISSKDEYETKENDSLLCTYVGEGKYELYINCTEMNKGLYGIKFVSSKYSKHTTFYITDF